MRSPIVARYQWTVDELLQARRCQMRSIRVGAFLRVAIQLIACLCVVGGVIGFLKEGADGWICGEIALGGIWYLVIRPIAVYFWTRYQFAKRPDRNKEIQWHFGDDSISCRHRFLQFPISMEIYSQSLCKAQRDCCCIRTISFSTGCQFMHSKIAANLTMCQKQLVQQSRSFTMWLSLVDHAPHA